MRPRVLYLTAGDRTLASTRYRVIFLKPYLKRQGVNSSIRKIYPTKRNGFRKFGKNMSFLGHLGYALFHDIVTIQKKTLTHQELSILSKFNDRIVYDFDDAIYTTPPWKKENPQRKIELDQTLQQVSYVIAGNPALAEYASKYCDNTFQAPTAIPKKHYMQYHNNISSSDSVVIGWIGNTENLWYLKQAEETISNILSENKDTELHIITDDQRSITPFRNRVGDDVHYIPWSEEKELNYLNKIDIGIRPLTHDEWSQAKGGFTSVIQCMGLRKPVVVTPVGMLENIVEHGSCGFHADSSDEWVEYLNYLIDSPTHREEMGNNAFERVGEKRFWTKERAADLASFYKSIYN